VSLAKRDLRTAAGVGFLLVSVALAAAVVWRDRHDLAEALHRLPAGSLVLSGIFATGSVVVTLFMWRAMLTGLDVDLPLKPSARVFFVGQLGKYLPGSVWPVLAQMELARRFRVPRPRMLACGVLTVVVNVAVGGALAVSLLPWVSRDAFRHFWWLPVCLPAIILALQPKIVIRLLERLLAVMRREPLGVTLTWHAEARTALWGVVSWLLLGAHIYVLADALGASGPRVMAAAVAAGSLAVSAGTLFVPAPAGAGVREVAFVLTLGPVLPGSSALLVALLSRVILVVVDVVLAIIAGAGSSWRPPGVLQEGSKV
jgi:glycosyltransferase 2 family protein